MRKDKVYLTLWKNLKEYNLIEVETHDIDIQDFILWADKTKNTPIEILKTHSATYSLAFENDQKSFYLEGDFKNGVELSIN